jgi:hypothetical protein
MITHDAICSNDSWWSKCPPDVFVSDLAEQLIVPDNVSISLYFCYNNRLLKNTFRMCQTQHFHWKSSSVLGMVIIFLIVVPKHNCLVSCTTFRITNVHSHSSPGVGNKWSTHCVQRMSLQSQFNYVPSSARWISSGASLPTHWAGRRTRADTVSAQTLKLVGATDLGLGWVILLKAQRIGRLCGVPYKDVGGGRPGEGLKKHGYSIFSLFFIIGLT